MCSRSETEQNLVAFQQNGRILFRVCRPISPGQEFRVWYAEEYAQGLGTIWDKIWNKKCISLGNCILNILPPVWKLCAIKTSLKGCYINVQLIFCEILQLKVLINKLF